MAGTSLDQVQNESGLGASFVRMSAAEATGIVSRHFSIEGSATRLETEKDDTFRIDGNGRSFVLKVSNPAEESDVLDFQTQLIRHVEARDGSLPIPSVITGNDGRLMQSIVDTAGQPRHVRLMTFLEGSPLDSTHSTAQGRRKIGEALARLRLATAGFSHEAASRVLAWDVQHLPGLHSLIEEVRDPRHRQMLLDGFRRFDLLSQDLAKLRRQVLHNDFSQSNILVDHDQDRFVTGVIDFGDAVHTAIAIDVSTALLNQLPEIDDQTDVDDIFERGRPLLEGYLGIADLTEQELRIVPHLVMGRVLARAVITTWRARLFPENSRYIMRNTQKGWSQLQWFLDRPFSSISGLLL